MAESVIKQAIYSLMLEMPFFARLILEMKIVEKEEITCHNGAPTYAATDGERLFICVKMYKTLNEKQKLGLICHEVLHCALGHIWRRNHKDPMQWNMACDYIVNQIVLENNMLLPDGILHDKKYKDMSAEKIYSLLDDCTQKQKQKWSDKGFQDMQDGMGNGEDGDGDDEKDGGSMSIGKGKPLSSGKQKELEQKWKSVLSEATLTSKMKGSIPAGMGRYIDDILNPALPWTTILSDLANEICQDDYDMNYPDRRLLDIVYLPDLHSEGIHVVSAMDMSGSIGQLEVSSFIAELRGILGNFNVKSLRIIACDADIHYDEVLEPDEPLPTVLPGGGGTDFRPVFTRLAKEMDEPTVLIYFTDGYGDFPEVEPNYPVIWVTQETGYGVLDKDKFPFGVVITKRLEEAQV